VDWIARTSGTGFEFSWFTPIWIVGTSTSKRWGKTLQILTKGFREKVKQDTH
jgi:hypothetical protein